MRETIAPEGPVMQFFARILDLAIVSILFTITCIPIVTVGCALTSLYYTVVKSVCHAEGQVLKSYFHCFRYNLKQSLGLGILCEVIAGVMIGNLYLIIRMDLGNAGILFGTLFLVILIVLFIMMSYGFPILARFEMTVWSLLQASCQLSVMHGKVTFQLLVMEIMLALSMLAAFITFPPLVILCPGVLSYAQAKVLEPVFERYMPKGGEQEHEAEII